MEKELHKVIFSASKIGQAIISGTRRIYQTDSSITLNITSVLLLLEALDYIAEIHATIASPVYQLASKLHKLHLILDRMTIAATPIADRHVTEKFLRSEVELMRKIIEPRVEYHERMRKEYHERGIPKDLGNYDRNKYYSSKHLFKEICKWLSVIYTPEPEYYFDPDDPRLDWTETEWENSTRNYFNE